MSVPIDELSFLNEQLAAMLRQGLPLEGSLREICRRMGRSELKAELQKLEADLAAGIPFALALAARKLPEFYVQTAIAGVKGNNLPAVLTLLADYYGQVHSISIRLKGLMFYPALVLVVSLLFTGFAAFLDRPAMSNGGIELKDVFRMSTIVNGPGASPAPPKASQTPRHVVPPNSVDLIGTQSEGRFHNVHFWMPPVFLLTLVIIAIGLLAVPPTRRALRWRLPAFKEASLAQFASGLHVLLKSGSTLHDALGFLLPMERGTPAGAEIQRWRKCLEDGSGKFPAMAEGSRLFPPLFLWLASSSGDDLASGFERAAEVYRQRALYRIELLLNGALPASMVVLGIMVALQVYPLASQAFSSMQQVYEFFR